MSTRKKTPKATQHSLKGVARRELVIELDKGHQSSDWSGELSPDMLEYAANDVFVLLPLAETLEAQVEEAGLAKVSEIEHRAILAMVWMKNAGVPFDVQRWEKCLENVKDDVHRLEEELAEFAPKRPGGERWNWRSHQQVKEAFALVGIKLPNTKEETSQAATTRSPSSSSSIERRRSS